MTKEMCALLKPFSLLTLLLLCIPASFGHLYIALNDVILFTWLVLVMKRSLFSASFFMLFVGAVLSIIVSTINILFH